jgi:hypothetical protein
MSENTLMASIFISLCIFAAFGIWAESRKSNKASNEEVLKIAQEIMEKHKELLRKLED